MERPGLPMDLKFCSLQSGSAPRLEEIRADTIVLGEMSGPGTSQYYYQSEAVLRVLTSLGGGWRLFHAAYIVPRFLRDWVYQFIARNRYRFFGKRETCRLPTDSEKSRFLS